MITYIEKVHGKILFFQVLDIGCEDNMDCKIFTKKNETKLKAFTKIQELIPPKYLAIIP